MRVDAGTDDERYASEYNKNAVHYAAWKGDAVNTISTGEGTVPLAQA